MAKAKNLNGLPGNIAMSYLSTYGYYDGGYMADWINYIAREYDLKEIEIDVLNKKIKPKVADIKPLHNRLEQMNLLISKELENHGFENGFIKKAVMNFEIPIDDVKFQNTIYCYPFIEDENGRIYKPKKRIIETAYETEFNAKKTRGILAKIKSILR